jgi:hypothetical protein
MVRLPAEQLGFYPWQRQKLFSSTQLQVSASYAMGTGVISEWLTQFYLEECNSPPSRSKVRIVWIFNYSNTYMFMLQCLNKANGNSCL